MSLKQKDNGIKELPGGSIIPQQVASNNYAGSSKGKTGIKPICNVNYKLSC